MNKVFYAQVGGLYYPLVFSLGAKRRMAEITKALMPIQKAIGIKSAAKLNEDERIQFFGEALDGISLIGEILIHQGAAYNNSFGSFAKIRTNSAVDEYGKWRSLSAEEILTLLEDDEIENFVNMIMKCLSSANGEIKTKLKNTKK
ncbi:hypothetical protein IMSAG250_00716 [Clostridiales bacterium]|nr:hypothetical protein IMSAG250_00716 [Clostridiales bacterium]